MQNIGVIPKQVSFVLKQNLFLAHSSRNSQKPL